VKNCGDNVFKDVPVGKDEEALVARFLAEHDFAPNTRKRLLKY
jgi:hypothetical protein